MEQCEKIFRSFLYTGSILLLSSWKWSFCNSDLLWIENLSTSFYMEFIENQILKLDFISLHYSASWDLFALYIKFYIFAILNVILVSWLTWLMVLWVMTPSWGRGLLKQKGSPLYPRRVFKLRSWFYQFPLLQPRQSKPGLFRTATLSSALGIPVQILLCNVVWNPPCGSSFLRFDLLFKRGFMAALAQFPIADLCRPEYAEVLAKSRFTKAY